MVEVASEIVSTVSPNISVGNLVTIVVIIVSALATIFANVIIVTSKTSKFVAVTEMKFQAGSTKFSEHDVKIKSLENKCDTCPQKKKLEALEREKDRMNAEQLTLRAALPIQLRNIETSIAEVKADVKSLRKDLQLSKEV